MFCRPAADRLCAAKSSKKYPAQLSAKAAMEYKTICFGSREMRRLVFHAANYGACGTGTLCREIGGWSL
ncbi:hypothetical protein FJ955_18165 [Mesorhizobium sp. B2-2-2]|nr:hypothetical protein FJ955_18165 [Mesorhizobium sp. B2-2-2]